MHPFNILRIFAFRLVFVRSFKFYNIRYLDYGFDESRVNARRTGVSNLKFDP